MANELTEAALLQALEAVKDPDLGQSIVSMGMIKHVAIGEGGKALSFTCELTTPACPVKDQIEREIRDTVKKTFPQVEQLDVKMTGKTVGTSFAADGPGENLIPQIRNVVAVASGKGGVGKSTVTVNLALALAKMGAKVAVLDLDVYGPSVPQLLGIGGRPKLQGETKITPMTVHGIETMSMGLLVEPRQAMIWRGPILGGLITQFLRDVTWSEADYLLIDLPPATCDVPLALMQCCALTGVVLVTTPESLSFSDVHRAKALFQQMRVPALGLVLNMAGYTCAACGKHHDIFSSAHIPKEIEALDVPLLGEIPIDREIAASAAAGEPILLRKPDGEASKALCAIAEKLAARISVRNLTGGAATRADGGAPPAGPVGSQAS